MSEITLSKAVRSNLLNLQSTAKLLASTQERLSTGLKVNSALDNPTNFFTAASLNSRAGDLGRLLDSVSNATQTLKAADNGITAITKLVESAQASARQALQAPAQTTTSTVAGNDSTAVFAPGSATTVTGTGAAVVARVQGTSDTSTLALNVAAATSFTINGTSFDLKAADTAGNADGTLSQAELSTYIGTWNTANTAGTGSTVSIDATTNNLIITQADATTNVALSADTNGALAALGLTAATTTARSTDLLQQGSFTQGDTLTVSVGSISKTVTFGTNGAGGEVNTLTELQTALNDVSNATVTVADTGNITIGANAAADAVTIASTGTNTASDVGLTAGEYTNLVNGTAGPVRQGEILSIGVAGSSTLNITFGTGSGQVNTIGELQATLDTLAGGTATVNTATGAIDVTAKDTSKAITIAASNPGSGRTAADISSAFGLTNAVTAPVTTDSVVRQNLETQYNDLLSQISALTKDASFNGVNLLNNGALKVTFNETGTSKLDISGVDFSASGLGLNKLAAGSFQSDTNINATLATIDATTASLRTQASKFGSNLSVVQTRQDFSKNLINTLQTGAANLTLADGNEEAANLLALQTRQSLSTRSLSLASRADQQVLQLLR